VHRAAMVEPATRKEDRVACGWKIELRLVTFRREPGITKRRSCPERFRDIRTLQIREYTMETQPPTASPAAPPTVDPREVLQKMLDGLGLLTKVEHYTMDGATLLHIATAEPGRLIGKHGQTLNELQFLLHRILQRIDKATPQVIVDCERYRERQRDELLKQVLDAADRVRRWGDPVK